LLLRVNISKFWEENYFLKGGKIFQERNLIFATNSNFLIPISLKPVSEFNEFEPRLKSAKTLFQLSAGVNLETILSGTNHV